MLLLLLPRRLCRCSAQGSRCRGEPSTSKKCSLMPASLSLFLSLSRRFQGRRRRRQGRFFFFFFSGHSRGEKKKYEFVVFFGLHSCFFSVSFPLDFSLFPLRRRHPRAREISLQIARRVRDESASINQVRPRESGRAQGVRRGRAEGSIGRGI